MAVPGEVIQLIGQAYQHVFIGALQHNIRYFENKFNVHTEPEKTTFVTRLTGKSYSFDFNGVYFHPLKYAEVFGECKGYSKGGSLLGEFKVFLAKAYVTCTDYQRHRNDFFWFVTNVPFACTEGTAILDQTFVERALKDNNAEVKEIIGNGHVDGDVVRALIRRLGVFILTDSFLMNTELVYKVRCGESLWTILKKFHAGRAPSGFRNIAQQIADENRLKSPDHVIAGKKIHFQWRGVSE